jgi:hypothetical protein
MQKYKIFKSQKGDAIILLSVLVTGIVLLVTAVVVENFRKSSELQSVQKQSVDNLYKAEEGIEYSLYANKVKDLDSEKAGVPFSVKVWENGSNVGDADTSAAFYSLKKPSQGRDLLITSENISASSDNNDIKRTVFANVPTRYYDQVPLWSFRNNCPSGNCSVSPPDSDVEEGNIYRIILNTGDYQRGDCGSSSSTGWCPGNTYYRVVLVCGSDKCKASGLKAGAGCSNVTDCNTISCSTPPTGFKEINFLKGHNTMNGGGVLISDWFNLRDDSSNNLVDLRNNKLVVEFTLTEGTLEEVSGLSGDDIKMCLRNSDADSWNFSKDKIIGLGSIEIRRSDNDLKQ